MQRPHESVFEKNPAFADLYPRLDTRLNQLLNPPEHETVRLHLEEVTRSWTKLKILWDEMQLILVDERYKALADSVSHHVTKVQFRERYSRDLASLGIPETHTFIETPSNLDERLEILSDVLAASLEEGLTVLEDLQRTSGTGMDLETQKQHGDAQMAEYRTANASLTRQLGQNVSDFCRIATKTLESQANHLENVKHGSVEKFVESYLKYHGMASSALLEKAERSQSNLINAVYTPDLRRALERHTRELKVALPQTRDRLSRVNEEIARHESVRTGEYNAAIADYQRLKTEVAQAERDVDKLLHYKSGNR